MPLHCRAIGKALLAHSDPALRREVLSAPLERRTPYTLVAPGLLRRQLAQVAEAGVAFEHEESAPGINCGAAPVFGPGDEFLAAISVTGPTSRSRAEAHTASVRTAATALSAMLTRPHRQRGV